MATTRDYLGYLNDKIEIAPANSQEELLAAEAIEQIMDEHGLDVHLQEFDAPASGELPHRIMMLLLCLGVFLAGLQGTPASIVGIIVTAPDDGARDAMMADIVAELGRCLVPVRRARAYGRDGLDTNRSNRYSNTHKRAF